MAIQKPNPELVKITSTPEEIYRAQRDSCATYAERAIGQVMAQLKTSYRPGQPVKFTVPESYGYLTDIVQELVVEALEAKNWKVKNDKGRTLTIESRGGAGPEDKDSWYGTLKFATKEGEVAGLMVVKTNPEMELGYDVVSHVEMPGMKANEVYVLDESLGWSWIGRFDGTGIPVEEQAIDLLKTYYTAKDE